MVMSCIDGEEAYVFPPQSVFVYWITSNIFSLGQTAGEMLDYSFHSLLSDCGLQPVSRFCANSLPSVALHTA